MSLRARIKRLETDVEWLNEFGELRMLEIQGKILRILEQICARDQALARRLGYVPPDEQKPEEPPGRDVALRVAPQDEGVGVAPVPPEPAPTPEPAPPPRKPEPPLVQPFHYDPPPEMQIRPVTWRQRGPQDYVDDPDDMYGRCIVDYDPLGYLDDDEDG